MKMITEILDLLPDMFTNEIPLSIWSDGCVAQRDHGNGPMNGIGGTIKNKVLDVKSGKVHIKEIKSLGEYADLAINKIKSLHL